MPNYKVIYYCNSVSDFITLQYVFVKLEHLDYITFFLYNFLYIYNTFSINYKSLNTCEVINLIICIILLTLTSCVDKILS